MVTSSAPHVRHSTDRGRCGVEVADLDLGLKMEESRLGLRLACLREVIVDPSSSIRRELVDSATREVIVCRAE